MKIQLHLKDPDGVYDSIADAAKASMAEVTGINDSEREELQENRREEIAKSLRQWVKYDEYVSVEIDTETQTTRVLDAQ
jgi:putative heme iron utilization protein